jgi:acyl-[acyl-carrier-protein]-phospholipid O-acyltransferase/long-chain-fatty-acid--[acyl-carrier-protein] ligase
MNASVANVETPRKLYGASGFWSLVVTQFQGAFNDNLYKLIMVFALASYGTAQGGVSERGQIMAIAGVVLAIPFILFPGLFGSLSDRFSKKRVAVWTKYLEVGIMGLGVMGFLLHEPMVLWAVMFLMASQSAMFGPAKYGILPEMLPEERLSWANGIVQMTTMIAIIAGTALAGLLFEGLGIDHVYFAGAVLVGLSAMGLIASYGISEPPAANPERTIRLNPWAGMGRDVKVILGDRWLRMIVFGYTYFWFAGALLFAAIMDFAEIQLVLGETETGILSAILSLGIGAGAMAAGYVSRGKIEIGLVPLGAGLLAVSCLLMPWIGVSYPAAAVVLLFIGVGGGLFDVPLAAGLQQRSPKEVRGGIIATTNMMTWVGILLGNAIYIGMGQIGLGSRTAFVFAGVATLTVLGISCMILPIMLVRSVLWILSNTIYRLKVTGRENIPEEGGALLVANHVSFIDALVITAAIDRPIRFIMADEIYQTRWIRPIAKMMNAIPISAMGGPRELVESLRTATSAIQNGELVCIFAEGQISRTGQMLPFRKGFERIMKGVEAPIVPVYLDQLWGSVFSFASGKFFFKKPRRIPYPIGVCVGKPLDHNSDSATVRTAVQELGSEAYMLRDLESPLLHHSFVRTARKHPFMMAIGDGRTPKLSFFKTYAGSIALARKLKKLVGPEEMIGLLLPQSVGGALANVAVQFMGKVAVNLNYTASAQSIESAARQCGIKHVLTAKEFLERFPVEVPGTPIYLDDVKKSITSADRIVAMLIALVFPVRIVERICGMKQKRTEEDLCTVIFSSGSEGEPKGVMLTHKNVLSNVESIAQVFPNETGDGMMGILPFFHSFGFMGTLWLPLWRGFRAAYHPNPLEAKIIGQLVYKYQPRFLIATPTFLQGFIRRCLPEEFSSLEYVVTGAEKLPTRVREAFRAKFGVEPLEGYGTTECSPAVSVNVPDYRVPGFFQKGTKHGTIGQAMPGVSVKVTDPDTGERLQTGQAGVLCVKGPNIMKGYLGQPEKTAEVLKDGWYNTGDIASIDEDGFITITDRLARFSKIAGEMVPHTKVEETLHQLLDMQDQTFAVTSVPDDQKGERLVVLHTLMDGELEVLVDKLKDCDLPNLWRPKATSFYRIAEIPVLGTGKMDLKRVKTLAKEMDVGE